MLQNLEEVCALKIRIKFEKTGCMKFVGHLDIMRYFQKVMRRADVDICYSEGFSPHQKMSFAAPLGVGLTSLSEYFDIEVNSTDSSSKMIERMNETMVEGMKVTGYRLLDENSKNAMSIVAAADYNVTIINKKILSRIDTFNDFMSQESINIVKKTKKSEMSLDIKPMILEYSLDNDKIFMKLKTGSENNLKPELVINAFYNYLNEEFSQFDINTERLEIYGKREDEIIPLLDFGSEIN